VNCGRPWREKQTGSGEEGDGAGICSTDPNQSAARVRKIGRKLKDLKVFVIVLFSLYPK
jgi:hypothetical protein